ncbi:MAG: hypothetical protein DCC68_10620 [Planctomycetota bacterium]|nr:MAG: hypothetical protein DCC68_10620 [Planctomycetota bacterium]
MGGKAPTLVGDRFENRSATQKHTDGESSASRLSIWPRTPLRMGVQSTQTLRGRGIREAGASSSPDFLTLVVRFT